MDMEDCFLLSEKVADATISYHDPLWLAGCARSINDIGAIIALDCACWILLSRRADTLHACGIKKDDLHSMLRQSLDDMLLRNDQAHPCFSDDRLEPLHRVIWIKRQIGSSRLENAKRANDHCY